VGQLKAEMRVNAAIIDAMEKGRFATRSEAGRFAANQRWKNHAINKKIAEFKGSAPLPTTRAGKRAAMSAPSLKGHINFDALAADLKKHGVTLDNFQAEDGTKVADLVYAHLTPERKKQWTDIISHFNDKRVPTDDTPTAYVLGGGAASGKSTPSKGLTLPLADPDDGGFEAVLANPDEVKVLFREYQTIIGSEAERRAVGADAKDGKGNPPVWTEAAGFMHEESSFITQMLIGKALRSKRNVVIDGVADNGVKKQYEKLDSYRAAGATRVEGVFFTTEIEPALERAMDRELKVGRLVKAETLILGHVGVSKNFGQYATGGMFDTLTLYDTNPSADGVKRATLIYDSKRGAKPILDQGLYDQFVAKKDYVVTP